MSAVSPWFGGAALTAACPGCGRRGRRIVVGERPGDLPVQQPTTFDFVVNVQAARALGLTPPNSVLVSAMRVIE